jgi:outer membrane protein assembly factor BamB
MFLGGPGREGVFDGSFAKAPSVLWARAEPSSCGGEFGGSPVVDGGLAVSAASSFHCCVTALEAESGATRWSIKTAATQSWPTSGISIARGAVFLATNHGLHALDANSGEPLWSAKLPGANGAPLVLDDVCVIGAKKGLHALSLEKRGRKAWTFALERQAGGNPAFRDGVIYFHGDKSLFALDASDGKKVHWKVPAFDMPNLLRAGPVVTADRVLYVAEGSVLASADRATGEAQWHAKVGGAIYDHGLAVSGDTIVVKDGDGRLHAFDVGSGRLRWSSNGGHAEPYGIGHAGPVIAGSTIVCVTVADTGDNPRRLCGLDLQSGELLWEVGPAKVKAAIRAEQKKIGSAFDGDWSWYCTPFVSNGAVYAQTDAGMVALR